MITGPRAKVGKEVDKCRSSEVSVRPLGRCNKPEPIAARLSITPVDIYIRM